MVRYDGARVSPASTREFKAPSQIGRSFFICGVVVETGFLNAHLPVHLACFVNFTGWFCGKSYCSFEK
jgi:hypothetical protein